LNGSDILPANKSKKAKKSKNHGKSRKSDPLKPNGLFSQSNKLPTSQYVPCLSTEQTSDPSAGEPAVDSPIDTNEDTPVTMKQEENPTSDILRCDICKKVFTLKFCFEQVELLWNPFSLSLTQWLKKVVDLFLASLKSLTQIFECKTWS
jgi:hypothetical protein